MTKLEQGDVVEFRRLYHKQVINKVENSVDVITKQEKCIAIIADSKPPERVIPTSYKILYNNHYIWVPERSLTLLCKGTKENE